MQGGAKCGDEYLPGIFTSLVDKSILEFVVEKSGLIKSKKVNLILMINIW